MNEKIQKFMNKIDEITDRLQTLPKQIDNGIGILKKPAISCIPALINKITSRFNCLAVSLFAMCYIIYCLKNALISMAYKNGPTGIAFGVAVAALVITIVSNYIIYKTNGIFDNIIKTSTCKISSLNIFAIMTLLFVVLAVLSLVGGIYMTFNLKDGMIFVAGLAGAVLFLLLALYNSVPEEFAIVEDKDASAGEDFTAIITFIVKVNLRLVPIFIFVLSIVAICVCVPEIVETYTYSEGDTNTLMVDVMMMMMGLIGSFLLIGFIPLFAYIYYLVNYVVLDLIRAVLSLPGKLDGLKK